MKILPGIIVLICSIFISCSFSSDKHEQLLKEAAKIHNEAITIATSLKEELIQLSRDTTINQDSIQHFKLRVKAWEADLVEVPGNEEHHHHEEGEHHHHNEKQPDLTAEQHVNIQKELKARIYELKARLDTMER